MKQPPQEVPNTRTDAMISIQGARTHNLKNLTLKIPRGQLVVITGPSGSGKSSLAFDTLFAEGQRQYLESMSQFSRQSIRQLPRPDVDRISGLEPALCLDQHRHRSSRRSTVGTLSEIYDFLRLLLARVGTMHCHQCGNEVSSQTPFEIASQVLRLPPETKVVILAPIATHQPGPLREEIRRIRQEGLVRLRIDTTMHDIEQLPVLHPSQHYNMDAVLDRIIVREGIRERLTEAIDNAIRVNENDQVAISWLEKGRPRDSVWEEAKFSTTQRCANCNLEFADVEPRLFSFNSPHGACEACQGMGDAIQFAPSAVLDFDRSLQSGAVRPWRTLTSATLNRQLKAIDLAAQHAGIDFDQPLSTFPMDAIRSLFFAAEKEAPGIAAQLQKEYATSDSDARLDELETYQERIPCPTCDGSRVNQQARSVRLLDRNIGQWNQIPMSQFPEIFQQVPDALTDDQREIAAPILLEMDRRARFLDHVGVGYLSLSRPVDTLSGGEHQRVRLATSLGTGLSNVMFVLDEPSVGLHAADNHRLIESFLQLKSLGNSVIVVDHDEDIMRASDHLIDMGPRAGLHGGKIVAQGTVEQIQKIPESVTGEFLSGRRRVVENRQRRVPDPDRQIRIQQASQHNLKSLSVDIPLGVFVGITGVSGSGKSTLIHQTLVPALRERLGLASVWTDEMGQVEVNGKIDAIQVVDQRPIGRTPRACPATFCGLMDPIRKLFAATREAKQLGFGIARFSFNSKSGWCPDCRGLGQRKIDMGTMPDAFVTCETCQGKRFNLKTLQVPFAGRSIADVLDLNVQQAISFFEGFEAMANSLTWLSDVGLGYLKLGQSATTLSGGEAQRIKLARELDERNVTLRGNVSVNKHVLYVLDEPTTGLHFQDVQQLLQVLHRLVDQGNSVIAIEHHLDVIASADWLIDLGPEGGDGGGEIIGEGTPESLSTQVTPTGKVLAEWFATQGSNV